MIVYLIRHTEVNNPNKLCYGQSEIGLATSYPKELTAIQNKLPASIEVVYSSPSKRCTKLVQDLFGDSYKEAPELMELNFGKWEQMAWAEIAKQELDEWGKDFVNFPCPEGESYQALSRRVVGFWETATAKSGLNNMAFITHGGVIRALYAYLSKTPLVQSFDLKVGYGAVFKVNTNSQQPILELL